MYVACPSCKTLYPVTAEQLRLAAGKVRCGQCQTLFNATEAVFEDPQQALAYEPPLQQELVQEIDALVGRALDEVPGEEVDTLQAGDTGGVNPEFAEAFQGEMPVEIEDELEGVALPNDTEEIVLSGTEVSHKITESAGVVLKADADHYAQPVSAEFTARGSAQGADELSGLSPAMMFHDDVSSHQARTSWGVIAASLLLTLILLAQYAYWDRYRLVQISALRPALEWLCAPLQCDLPLRHDLAQLEMIEREVRDHPRVEDALLVNAVFVNRAPHPQAYPVLQVSFSDVVGTPIAVRRFLPEEYLRKKNAADGMVPGEQTLVMLEVVDPGERAVSFQFDFM
jgi:predicted Zn finger-like uncharacterized protein